MSEDRTQTTAVAVRERLIAEAPVAIWDSADFEQMQRVGLVLARSGFVPLTLCMGKERDDTGKEIDVLLSEHVIAARCVLICNQARLWGADPLAVLQCTSLVSGRLMYEGKLVAAVITSLTGVRLRYHFGVWDTDHMDEVKDRSELNGIGERLAIRAFDPEDPERFVEGSVGMWKTTRNGSPWSAVGNWPRQLRYRSAREWARAFEPGSILGILADGDEDIDELGAVEFNPRRSRTKADLKAKLPAPGSDGFSQDQIDGQIGAPKGSGIPETAEDGAADAEFTEGAQDGSGEKDGDESPASPEADAGTGGAQAAQGDASFRTNPVSPTRADLGLQAPDVATSEGYPKPDELHHLEGSDWTWDEGRGEYRRETFKNGQPFSSAAADKGLPVYADFAPAQQDGDPPGQAAAAEEGDALPPDFAKYGDAIETVATWDETKIAMREFFSTQCFKDLTIGQQNKIRSDTWDAMIERKIKVPDHASDISAFRLWIEWVTDPAAIEGTAALLERDPEFQKKDEAAKTQIRTAAAARLQALKG